MSLLNWTWKTPSGGTSRSPSSGREKTTTGGFFGLGGGGGGAWAWAWGCGRRRLREHDVGRLDRDDALPTRHAAGDLQPLAGVAAQARVEAPPRPLRLLPADPDREDVVLQHPVRRAPPARGRQVAEEVLAAELPQDRHHLAVVARGLRDELLERHGRRVTPGLSSRPAGPGCPRPACRRSAGRSRRFWPMFTAPVTSTSCPTQVRAWRSKSLSASRRRVDEQPLAERAAQRVGQTGRPRHRCRAGPACARPCRRRTPASGAGRRARPRSSSRTASRSRSTCAAAGRDSPATRASAERTARVAALWRRPMPEYRHKKGSPGGSCLE